MLRREFLTTAAAPALVAAPQRPPNVIFLLTDDQGYGDLSCHGNKQIRTPNVDRLADESVRFTDFHSCPVCSPTRASLMTGRYNYRTGVVDTYLGRSMMYRDEVTAPEMFRAAGYRTGIFGKWHLGDNYPLRAIDHGFDEALVLLGGGLAQPSGPPGNGYFDPILEHNGKPVSAKGYCTDIFTNATLEFVEANRNRPFFAYLPTNAPHDPLQVDDKYVAPYSAMGLDERTARVYGMIANIDENLGRVVNQLKKLDLDRNTILVFMTDNGPAFPRFNAGLRGVKGTVYEGGIRVPFFVRWTGRLKTRSVPQIAAHIDVLPTLLEACGIPKVGVRPFDGVSVWPLMTGQRVNWADRNLFFQWHRGDAPEAFRNAAVRSQRYKLVDGKELYDLGTDLYEKKDVASSKSDVVDSMRRSYDRWFADVSSRGYDPPRPILGTSHQNPVTLTRQDWRGPRAGWNPDSLGYWEVEVAKPGPYQITLRFPKAATTGRAVLHAGATNVDLPVTPGAESVTFSGVELGTGRQRLEPRLEFGANAVGTHYVDVLLK